VAGRTDHRMPARQQAVDVTCHIMKRQISHDQTQLIQLLFFLLGLTLASFLAVLFFNGFSDLGKAPLIGSVILVGLLFYYYSTKFYKVLFDNDFLYFSKFRQANKISIDKVISIKTSVFPLRFFYRNVYVLTIEFTDNDLTKKIKFLSKGATGLVGTTTNIPYFDILRQLISDKKYGR
jgi:hypothetical protein